MIVANPATTAFLEILLFYFEEMLVSSKFYGSTTCEAGKKKDFYVSIKLRDMCIDF